LRLRRRTLWRVGGEVEEGPRENRGAVVLR
jgi:hypothetical protein